METQRRRTRPKSMSSVEDKTAFNPISSPPKKVPRRSTGYLEHLTHTNNQGVDVSEKPSFKGNIPSPKMNDGVIDNTDIKEKNFVEPIHSIPVKCQLPEGSTRKSVRKNARRRSSFAPGKIGRENVEPDHVSGQMEIICAKIVQDTVNNLTKQFPKFQPSAEVIAKIEENLTQVVKKVFSSSALVGNKTNTGIEKEISRFFILKSKCELELKDWDALKENLKTSVEEARLKSSDEPKPCNMDFLSDYMKSLLSKIPDFNQMDEDHHRIRESIGISRLHLKKSLKAAEKYTNRIEQALQEKTSLMRKKMPCVDMDPKSLISDCFNSKR